MQQNYGIFSVNIFNRQTHMRRKYENKKTSSSAVAERPRDALCLLVVSFNSVTASGVFYYCYFGFRFTTAYNAALLSSA